MRPELLNTGGLRVPIKADDFMEISDLLGRYCWLFDSGETDAWAALWTHDGVFAGITPEPIVGWEALKTVPRDIWARNQGKLRHLIGNLHCDHESGDPDIVIARYYNLVTTWFQGGVPMCLAISTLRLTRSGTGWLIQRNDSETLA